LAITNGPQDTTVCMNDMAECTCGFNGANPLLTTPNWRIVTRSSDGSVVSNITINGMSIVHDKDDGLKWVIGQANSTSSPNSKLVVGPVNETHNQSSYQCVFPVNQIINGITQTGIVHSSIGTLTVVGKNLLFKLCKLIFIHATDPRSIGKIVVDEICATSLSVSWNAHFHPACGVQSQLITISSSTTSTFVANDSNYTFTNLNSNTSYAITVTLRLKGTEITTRSTTIKTSPLYRMSDNVIVACIIHNCLYY